jgi:peptide chain release factor
VQRLSSVDLGWAWANQRILLLTKMDESALIKEGHCASFGAAGAQTEMPGCSLLWICPSPYRPRHGRKNWFIGGAVFNAGETGDGPGELDCADIRFEAVRASGPGGQHVNKTDSAVRATHVPSGLSVKVQTERSQHANKRLARALLAHKLANVAEVAASAERQQRWQSHRAVPRGLAQRTFVGERFIERLACP